MHTCTRNISQSSGSDFSLRGALSKNSQMMIHLSEPRIRIISSKQRTRADENCAWMIFHTNRGSVKHCIICTNTGTKWVRSRSVELGRSLFTAPLSNTHEHTGQKIINPCSQYHKCSVAYKTCPSSFIQFDARYWVSHRTNLNRIFPVSRLSSWNGVKASIGSTFDMASHIQWDSIGFTFDNRHLCKWPYRTTGRGD